MESSTENSKAIFENNNAVSSKSLRHRKKQKFNVIRQQIEFYFGDSNLSKDRFLKKLIDEDPCKSQHTYFHFIILLGSVAYLQMLIGFKLFFLQLFH